MSVAIYVNTRHIPAIGLNWTVGLTPFKGRFEDISLAGIRFSLNGPDYLYM